MDVLKIPNNILTSKANPINDFSGMESIAGEMIDSAIRNNLVGLAGNQVGILERIFVINVMAELSDEKSPAGFITFINPIIKPVKEKGKSYGWEGCGSIPNLACLVERWNHVIITANSTAGEVFSLPLFGIDARIAQHELNHLDGILMTSKARQRQVIK